MAIQTPEQLVEEYKKSGEFDSRRRELLASFQRSADIASFNSRVEDVTRQRLVSDPKLQGLPQDSILRELNSELDRYPIIERAIADMTMLSSPAFAAGIKTSAERILQERRGDKDNGSIGKNAPGSAAIHPSRYSADTNSNSTSAGPSFSGTKSK